MDDAELAAGLEQIRAALADQPGEPADAESHLRAMRLRMRAAWLLIALGRYDEAVTSAQIAGQERSAAADMTPGRRRGAVLWQACEAEAVAHLARGRWDQAEKATHRALSDFADQDRNFYLYELALHAQGRLRPDRVREFPENHGRKPGEFDARQYAIRRIEPSPVTE